MPFSLTGEGGHFATAGMGTLVARRFGSNLHGSVLLEDLPAVVLGGEAGGITFGEGGVGVGEVEVGEFEAGGDGVSMESARKFPMGQTVGNPRRCWWLAWRSSEG
jgi:hypothetical protein